MPDHSTYATSTAACRPQLSKSHLPAVPPTASDDMQSHSPLAGNWSPVFFLQETTGHQATCIRSAQCRVDLAVSGPGAGCLQSLLHNTRAAAGPRPRPQVADPQRWGLVPARPSWGQENAGYGRRAQLQPSRGHAPPLTPTGRGRETAVGPAGRGAEGASDPEGQGPEPRSHGDHSASIAHHPARLEARAGAGNHHPILGPGKVA